MISKGITKLIRSLEHKKNRQQEQLFVAEGPKVVDDLLAVLQPTHLLATAEWMGQHRGHTGQWCHANVVEVTDDELKRASFLQHPQQVLAIFPIMSTSAPTTVPADQLSLALDGVQDPGNLGTIIRIADWFGIEHIYCSEDTADVYNPKVVQATMGSMARVAIHYTHLPQLLHTLPDSFPIYGTLLDGQDIYDQPLTSHGLIVMGNEGKGISREVQKLVNRRLLIPHFPADRETADSLNVAVATAITCAEFRRKQR